MGAASVRRLQISRDWLEKMAKLTDNHLTNVAFARTDAPVRRLGTLGVLGHHPAIRMCPVLDDAMAKNVSLAVIASKQASPPWITKAAKKKIEDRPDIEVWLKNKRLAMGREPGWRRWNIGHATTSTDMDCNSYSASNDGSTSDGKNRALELRLRIREKENRREAANPASTGSKRSSENKAGPDAKRHKPELPGELETETKFSHRCGNSDNPSQEDTTGKDNNAPGAAAGHTAEEGKSRGVDKRVRLRSKTHPALTAYRSKDRIVKIREQKMQLIISEE